MTKELAFRAQNSIAWQNVTVKQALRRLAGHRQKPLEVRPDIQEEKIFAFSKDRTTAEVTKDIANLLGGTWRAIPNIEKPESYLLTKTFEANRREEAFWAYLKSQAVAPYRKLMGYLKEDPETFRKLEAKANEQGGQPEDPALQNGNLFYLRNAPNRTALALLCSLSDDQIFEGMKQGRLFLSARSLSLAQQQAVQGLTQFAGNLLAISDPTEKQARARETIQFGNEMGIWLYLPLDPLKGDVPQFGFGFGGMQYIGMSGGTSSDNVCTYFQERGNPYIALPPRRIPQYRELEGKVFPAEIDTSAWNNATWGEVVGTLAKHLPFPLYSDSFAFLPTPQDRGNLPLVDLANKPLSKALDILCNRYHYLWWYQDGAILFRSRSWLLEKRYEVPNSTLTLLEKQLKAKGRLDNEGINALAELTPQQLEGLEVLSVTAKGGLRLAASDKDAYMRLRTGTDTYSAYHYLRLFKHLSTEQKREVMEPAGIPIERMSREQQQALANILKESQGSEIGYQPKGAIFKIVQKPIEGGENTLGVQLILSGIERPKQALFAQLAVAVKRPPAPSVP
jgi:hypothetical protein